MARKVTILEMNDLARKNGGQCLSTKYINAKTKLRWKCSKGHIFESTPDNVKSGSWCKSCRQAEAGQRRRLTIGDMHELAAKRNGKCLSSEYVTNQIKLQWQCENGHKFSSTPMNIRAGRWCRVCSKKEKHSIEKMIAVARERKGKCLSKEYVNSKTKLTWECFEGHVWQNTPSKILAGQWCPECSKGLSERICRAYFEQMFNERFPSVFPDWLRSPAGSKLELDGYSIKLGLAFEHQGRQHYEVDGRFTKSRTELKTRKQVDDLKRRLCKENGVVLIEIEELLTKTKLTSLREVIIEKCKEQGISVPSNAERKVISLKRAYAPDVMDKLKQVAKERGGLLLSKEYHGANNILDWQCKEGHIWSATPGSVTAGTWCQRCSLARTHKSQVKYGIEDMREIARQHGGRCLSADYKGRDTKLLWQCQEGHKWETKPAKILLGRWCRKCADNNRPIKHSLNEIQRIARSKGGECISDSYLGVKSKLMWRCEYGHEWEATVRNVLRGSWCPYCGGSMRSNIKDMHKLAAVNGGVCLSTKYVNTHTKLEWKCSKGHKWKAIPATIKKGGWCPECARAEAGSRRRIYSISSMQEVAATKGGRCVSQKYSNTKTHLEWECLLGHRWKAKPEKILTGTWCPQCARAKKKRV